MKRREFLASATAGLSSLAALALGSAACTQRAAAAARPRPAGPAAVGPPLPAHPLGLWSWFDLPADDPRSRELSGIAWDAARGHFWAVQDEKPLVVALVPDADLQRWSFGPTITIDIGTPVDLEGLVVLPDGFLVCSEDGARIAEVDREGRHRRDIPIPPSFGLAVKNRSLESLALDPSGRYLFTTTELALPRDGARATMQRGTVVRILRLDWRARARADGGTLPFEEWIYETDPIPVETSDFGIADVAALSSDELIVLERGWAKGYGNTARLYRTTLANESACRDDDAITSKPPLAKSLAADIGKLVAPDLPAPRQAQPSAILDNFEGVAVGPRRADGRVPVVVVSDDNGRPDQVARILVLV